MVRSPRPDILLSAPLISITCGRKHRHLELKQSRQVGVTALISLGREYPTRSKSSVESAPSPSLTAHSRKGAYPHYRHTYAAFASPAVLTGRLRQSLSLTMLPDNLAKRGN